MQNAHPRVFLRNTKGLTLIELVVVVVILGAIAAIGVQRIGPIIASRQKSEIREFGHIWEVLYQEALLRGEAYRLILNLDEHSYHVRREVMPESETSIDFQTVDLLSNLRTKGEQKRRKEEEQDEESKSLQEEYEEDSLRQSGDLQELFYKSLFHDSEGNVRLALPTEFPSLGETRTFSNGLLFKEIITPNDSFNEGEVAIRFSPRGGSDFAVVYLVREDDGAIFTVFLNPNTGQVKVEEGEKRYEWTFQKKNPL